MLKRCDQVASWQKLNELKVTKASLDLTKAFVNQANRFEHFSAEAPHVFVDLSKCMWDEEVEKALLELANETKVFSLRDALFKGDSINTTEGRSVMHWLLRTPKGAQIPAGLESTHAEVLTTLDAFLSFAEKVRSNDSITDVVNIGIGGSDLGPQMAIRALAEYVTPTKSFHFISNIDAHEITGVLDKLDPNKTLFLISSKSFTTIETMTNAQTAKQWFINGGGKNIDQHFVGLTSNVVLAKEFGIDTTFGFWVWGGGPLLDVVINWACDCHCDWSKSF